MFNEKFLNLEHKKSYPYLIQLFNEKTNCIDCFLHQEYTYGGCDWYSRETWSIGLENSLRYDEKIQIVKKKKTWEGLIEIDLFLCIYSVFFTSQGERLNMGFFFILRSKKEASIFKKVFLII